MPDARFFQRAGPFSLAEIADRIGAHLEDAVKGSLTITDVATLEDAEITHLSSFVDPRYYSSYIATGARAVLTTRHLSQNFPGQMFV